MNGLTGQKMQKIFKALVPESVYDDPRNLVEYCCFRFLSRNSADVYPSLKEPAFQRLAFITMLAWQNPHRKGKDSRIKLLDKNTFHRKLVGEEAFIRIAPAVAGVADIPTVHNLFKALAGDENGISFSVWSTYINELIKVHEGRSSYQSQEFSSNHSEEKILCLGSSRKQPVIKWEKNMAWPGKLTLTDKALYFEVLCSSSDALVLEFVDLGGEMRRDVWFAFIHEVISLHRFISEYGPRDGDPSVHDVYGAHKCRARAAAHAANSIARLQALQFMRRTASLDDPTKLVQLSYLHSAPYGDVVLQTLAVSCWGGPAIRSLSGSGEKEAESLEYINHVYDVDGSVYLRKWMRSGSWGSSASLAFWRSSVSVRKGVVLGKNLVVGDMNLVERAAVTCRDRYRVAEKTQATIDAAMIEGIPSNVDLFKELVLPLTLTARNFERLRRWKDPLVTASFLALMYTLIFRNLVSYAFPKIIALKEAMREVEKFLQNVNVVLLKIRSVILSGHPQVTTEVALALLFGSTVLLVIPFKYIIAFVIFDLFTRELEFRREMVQAFMKFVKERWDVVPAAPVVVLPFEDSHMRKTQVDNNEGDTDRATQEL
ncbi:Plant protein of unknown function (DUF639 [Striga hermonthica]|uniref:Uncharacterized protein n=1 Tax=Striga hermonthica TaxID=68872 RepID=A0A9N7MJX8_STRHE|nr:Plant protein of unknown function (DUF639 [Striga hermonthica]